MQRNLFHLAGLGLGVAVIALALASATSANPKWKGPSSYKDRSLEVLIGSGSCSVDEYEGRRVGLTVSSTSGVLNGTLDPETSLPSLGTMEEDAEACRALVADMQSSASDSGCDIGDVIERSDSSFFSSRFRFVCTSTRDRIVMTIGALSKTLFGIGS